MKKSKRFISLQENGDNIKNKALPDDYLATEQFIRLWEYKYAKEKKKPPQ